MNKSDANSVLAKDRAHVLHPNIDVSTFHREGRRVLASASGMYVTDK